MGNHSNEADFDLIKLMYAKVPSRTAESASLLDAVKRTEKQTFPTREAFQFDSELAKRTTNLYCAYLHTVASIPRYQLCGYVVYLRTKALTRIHKVCVVESIRGNGVGRFMVAKVIEELRRSGAGEVDLWVDEGREPARGLYKACGFKEMEAVENYYGKGRTGIRMRLEL
ncbi:acetyltransferase, GNAT family [Terfezia claveryi]|nr:acetyltransferase, GNAT family [Terfezia claveryi]